MGSNQLRIRAPFVRKVLNELLTVIFKTFGVLECAMDPSKKERKENNFFDSLNIRL
jgi:hypothetical protein